MTFKQLIIKMVSFRWVPNNGTPKPTSQPIWSFPQDNIVVSNKMACGSFKIPIIKWLSILDTIGWAYPSLLGCNQGSFLNGYEILPSRLHDFFMYRPQNLSYTFLCHEPFVFNKKLQGVHRFTPYPQIQSMFFSLKDIISLRPLELV